MSALTLFQALEPVANSLGGQLVAALVPMSIAPRIGIRHSLETGEQV
jgi:hypothetical protein